MEGNTVDLTGDAYIQGVNVVAGMFGTYRLNSTTDTFEGNGIILDSVDDLRITTLTATDSDNGGVYNVCGYIFGNFTQDQNMSPNDSIPAENNTITVGGDKYEMTFLREEFKDTCPIAEELLSNYIQDGTLNAENHSSRNPINDYGVMYNVYLEHYLNGQGD